MCPAPIQSQPLDKIALQRLLLDREAHLRQVVAKRLGVDLQATLSVDDVLQEIWISAFKQIARFHPDGRDAFDRWLMSLAMRTVINMAKAARRLKRGGGRRPLPGDGSPRSGYLTLFNQVVGDHPTPSREVAAHETADAIRVVLTQLPKDRQRVIEMRYIEGKSLGEISEATGKTGAAVRSIIYHGLRQMRARLGDAGRFFSDAPSTAS